MTDNLTLGEIKRDLETILSPGPADARRLARAMLNKASGASEKLSQECLADMLRRLANRIREKKITLDDAASSVGEALREDPVEWDVVVILQGLVLATERTTSQEPLVVGPCKLFRTDAAFLDSVAQELEQPATDASALRARFLNKVCCRTRVQASRLDQGMARAKAILLTDAMLAFVRIGAEAASLLEAEPQPLLVGTGEVLVRRIKDGKWRLVNSLPRHPVTLGEKDVNALFAITGEHAVELLASGARGTPLPGIGKRLCSGLLCLNEAEKAASPGVRFLKYMTALEQLLTVDQKRGSESTTYLLCVRAALLYNAGLVPGRLPRPDAVSPEEVARLYDRRSEEAHGTAAAQALARAAGKRGGEIRTLEEDTDLLRALCYSCLVRVAEFSRDSPLAQAGDVRGFFDACIDILAILGTPDCIKTAPGHYVRLAGAQPSRDVVDMAWALLTENGFLEGDEASAREVSARGHEMLRFLRENVWRMPPFGPAH